MSERSLLPRHLNVPSIPTTGIDQHIVAKPTELLQIADYLGLLELRSLTADITAARSGSTVALTGRVRAELAQRCVVTLVPVVQSVDEAFDRRLVRVKTRRDFPKPHPEVGVDEADPPDLYAGDAIDLGAIVLEQLALAIDPYPRAPGAELPPPASADAEHADSPFAVLKSLGQSGSS